jgi:N-acyl-D-aspartate/D-glutamate deacylase
MSKPLDILIKNAKIVDGTGEPSFRGGIGITGEKITAVGKISAGAARVIDANELVACPGFVDPHSHADLSILKYPLAENLIGQGITTFVGGNCGVSLAPVRDTDHFRGITKLWGLKLELGWHSFGEWLSSVGEKGLSINYAPLVGHNTIRSLVISDDARRMATPDEIEKMKVLVHEAMKSGSFGLSVGLDAAMPGHFADTGEVDELVRTLKDYDGLFAPHARHHQNQWPAESPTEHGYGIFHAPRGEIITGRYHGMLETVEIAKRADGVRLHIAHLTPAYLIPQPHPALLDKAAAEATLADIIDKARDEGLEVTFNVIAWSQSIGSELPMIKSFFSSQLLLPSWLKDVPREEFPRMLRDEDFRSKLREVILSGKFKFGMLNPVTDPYWMDCFRIIRCKKEEYEGRTVGEIAREKQPDHILRAVYRASFETVFDLLYADPSTTWALTVDKREHGALPTFLKHPAGMPCTDVTAFSGKPSEEDGMYGYGVSPTAYGLFPHYIREFIRERRVLSLEEGIRKATSVPAQEVLGLSDRGVISEGAFADILLFDYDRISECNDFRNPSRQPSGINYVLVNGNFVWEHGRHTGKRPGKILRHT